MVAILPLARAATVAVPLLVVSHGAVWWHGWSARGDREADRVAAAEAARDVARARVDGLTEAYARAAVERAELQRMLDDAARADPDADRVCLGADSVQRLAVP